MRVLIAEDNDADAYVIKYALDLCKQKFKVDIATNGERALEFLKEAAETCACPQLLLLDLNLPKITGLELLKTIRDASICAGMRIIVVTSSTRDADRDAARMLGVDTYFQKPTDLDKYLELATLVDSLYGAPPN